MDLQIRQYGGKRLMTNSNRECRGTVLKCSPAIVHVKQHYTHHPCDLL